MGLDIKLHADYLSALQYAQPPSNTIAINATALNVQKGLLTCLTEAERNWDLEFIEASRTEGCTSQVLPKSLHRPVLDRHHWRREMEAIKHLFWGWKVHVHETMHDPEQHKATVHLSASASTAIGPFAMESVFLLSFTDDGSKVRHIVEFVDSAYIKKFMAELLAGSGSEDSHGWDKE